MVFASTLLLYQPCTFSFNQISLSLVNILCRLALEPFLNFIIDRSLVHSFCSFKQVSKGFKNMSFLCFTKVSILWSIYLCVCVNSTKDSGLLQNRCFYHFHQHHFSFPWGSRNPRQGKNFNAIYKILPPSFLIL